MLDLQNLLLSSTLPLLLKSKMAAISFARPKNTPALQANVRPKNLASFSSPRHNIPAVSPPTLPPPPAHTQYGTWIEGDRGHYSGWSVDFEFHLSKDRLYTCRGFICPRLDFTSEVSDLNREGWLSRRADVSYLLCFVRTQAKGVSKKQFVGAQAAQVRNTRAPRIYNLMINASDAVRTWPATEAA